MAHVDRIMVAVGVGAAMLRIRLPKETYSRGTDVTGFILVEGGLIEQHIRSITIKLEEYHHAGWTPFLATRNSLVVAKEVTISPESQSSYRFTFRIPDDARLTESSGAAGWRLEAEADISWAVNPNAHIELKIVAHPDVVAVFEAFQRMGFVETGAFHLTFREAPDAIIKHYSAPHALRKHLIGATLQLWVQGPWINGWMILTHRQQGISQITGWVGGSRESHVLSIPRADMFVSSGHIRARRAIPYLGRILKQALTLSESEEQTLLRAAAKPPDKEDSLLHPADGVVDETDPNKLLRPTEE